MTIELLVIVGSLVGLATGFILSDVKRGCVVLLIIAVTLAVVIGVALELNRAGQNSTSAVGIVIVPLWLSLGSVPGFVVARLLRRFAKRE